MITKYFLLAVIFHWFASNAYELKGEFNNKNDCEYVLKQINIKYMSGDPAYICSTTDLSKPPKDN